MRNNDRSTSSLGEAVQQAVAALDLERMRNEYWAQDETVLLERFLPPEVVIDRLVPQVETLKPHVTRSLIPWVRKGGSVGFHTLMEKAPDFVELYRSPQLTDFLSRLVGTPLMLCPESDPHSCALYFYTEPGDYMCYHYDTSYYKGARYTVLLGLIQRSERCRLVCQFYRDDPARRTKELQVVTDPGSLVIFNGDKLWHAVTPLGAGEERVIMTMEYLTTQAMGPLKRIVSDLKDAFVYFGIWGVLRRALSSHPRSTPRANRGAGDPP